MKLKETFITYENDGDHILIDASSAFAGLVHSNKTAAFIVDCLKSETTEAEIADKMCGKYDAPREEIEKGVRDIIGKLKSIGAIDE